MVLLGTKHPTFHLSGSQYREMLGHFYDESCSCMLCYIPYYMTYITVKKCRGRHNQEVAV